MSSPDLNTLADVLEREVAAVRLAPASAIRRRGEARQRRTVAVGAVAVVALTAGATAGTVHILDQRPSNRTVVGAPVGLPVTVFYTDDATESDKRAVEAAVGKYELIGEPYFESREEAWERFKRQFRDAPDLVAATKPESLPESERLTLANPADYPAFRQRVETLPGVSEIVAPGR